MTKCAILHPQCYITRVKDKKVLKKSNIKHALLS